MAVDYDSLTRAQKTTYDFAVGVAKMDPESEELEKLLGLQAQPKTRIRREQLEVKQAITREANAVLLHLRKTDTLKQKLCLNCKQQFATNYEYVGCCSDDCLKEQLAGIGIDWNPEKTAEERWHGPYATGEIPAIVRPETLSVLKNWAKVILSWDDIPSDRKDNDPVEVLDFSDSAGNVDVTPVLRTSEPEAVVLPFPVVTKPVDDDPFADI